MPRRKSSIKRKRADKKRHLKNIRAKLPLKKKLKKFKELIEEKNISEAKALLNNLYSLLDKAAKKKLLHPNTSKRKKARLTKSLNRLK